MMPPRLLLLGKFYYFIMLVAEHAERATLFPRHIDIIAAGFRGGISALQQFLYLLSRAITGAPPTPPIESCAMRDLMARSISRYADYFY